MKSAIKAGLLLLAALALPASVYAYGCPLFPGAGGRPCTVQLGPWYLYYPYEAHFQLPAPVGYPMSPGVGSFPNWQAGAAVPVGAPSAAPVGAPSYVPPTDAPWQPPAPQPLVQPSSYIQPAGYQQPPSYWYGNR
jgi:hypothetical protein